MSPQYKKLKATLETMFQLDQPDLDFGIYRIMNQKREEVTDFLNNRLLKQVKDTLSQAAGADRDKLKKELDQKEYTLREMGVDPTTNDKWQELQAEYQTAASPEAMENEVYSHLTNFFRRYYHQGDFISQRRYKEGVYAIPYEGEEVKLHWANHDQYYIKTSEYFKNYRFDLPNGKKVNFELLEASTEQNNNKAQNNKERRFKLAEETVFEEEGNELKIFFTYEPTDKKQKQDDLMADAFETLKEKLPQAWLQELLRPKPTEKNKYRTLLEKHLKDYTARNTFDYFIHKDLGSFLRRELDFYIKNEILHIDDINLDSEQDFQKQLLLIKALKGVAQKIIDFLAQLEDFQKKLWLKKKFVLQSDYCLTLDRIDESFYADIAASEAQRQEWVKLFAIEELEDYSEPLTENFLKNNPFLVVDTQFFDRSWKYKLLGTLDRLDEHTDGLLVNSENFQALQLLQEKYKEQVKCIYIDPPYNTGSDGFAYKDNYQHSSWLSLMFDRIELSNLTLRSDGVMFTSINDNESSNLEKLLSDDAILQTRITIKVRHEDRILRRDIPYQEVHEDIYVSSKTNEFKPGRREDDSAKDPLAEYVYKVKLLNKASQVIELGGYQVEVYKPKDFEVLELEPSAENLRRYTIRGSLITQKGSASEFYELNLRSKKEDHGLGTLYKVIGMGVKGDGLGYRYIMQPEKVSAKNGIYFQAVPLKHSQSANDLPFPNFYDLVKPFNNSVDEGGLSFSNGKKPLALLKKLIQISNIGKVGYLLDYFSGSGTTGHAVINLNREDGGQRKYILVEMGEYFNTVTKPRIQKVIYSEDWKNGKPLSRKGSSHCFKYLRLESYEDTLNNLQLQRTKQQAQLLGNEHFEEEYRLHYMLEVESRESLFSTDIFKRPFGYSLKSIEHNEIKEGEVDLVETFNYLIGLVVDSIQMIKDYVVVIGDNLEGEHIAVIWRDVEKQDNAALNAFFRKTQINPRDTEFDRIYVNGDNNLENLKTAEDKWKVVLIEEEFKKRMFEEKSL